mmetsp:Transcript_41631/g.131352  ORF Transcript_41631/g.131352 Transcript_41631/m.131352 type:complete len:314 (+) Transcript_41631:153-1094(+)
MKTSRDTTLRIASAHAQTGLSLVSAAQWGPGVYSSTRPSNGAIDRYRVRGKCQASSCSGQSSAQAGLLAARCAVEAVPLRLLHHLRLLGRLLLHLEVDAASNRLDVRRHPDVDQLRLRGAHAFGRAEPEAWEACHGRVGGWCGWARGDAGAKVRRGGWRKVERGCSQVLGSVSISVRLRVLVVTAQRIRLCVRLGSSRVISKRRTGVVELVVAERVLRPAGGVDPPAGEDVRPFHFHVPIKVPRGPPKGARLVANLRPLPRLCAVARKLDVVDVDGAGPDLRQGQVNCSTHTRRWGQAIPHDFHVCREELARH